MWDSFVSYIFTTLSFFWTSASAYYWDLNLVVWQAYYNTLVATVLNFTAQLDTTYGLTYLQTLLVFKFLLSSLIFVVLGLLITLYLMNQGIALISYFSNGVDVFSDVFATLAEIDEEIGSLDDAVIYGLVFLVIIAWFIYFTLFITYYLSTLAWFVALLNLIFLTAVLTPIFVLYSFGGAFTTYVRGVGRTSSILMETFLDFVAVGVMIARFLIQNIRLLLIFAAFFELSEFIYMNCNFTGTFLASKFFSFNVGQGYCFTSMYWYDWVSDFLVTQLLLIYYWGHLTLTFIVQLINYFCLSFYLFFFLYTTFLLETHEKYFLHKRVLLA